MSRVEPNRNVYVGHRYVPKIFGEWDKQNEYEGLSIVTNKGTSYTSKKRVPVGIDILNEEYWVVTGNYDAQVESYRQDVRNVENDVLNLDTELTGLDNKVDNSIVENKEYVDTSIAENKDHLNTSLTQHTEYINNEIETVSDDLKDRGINGKEFGLKMDGSNESDLLQEFVDYCFDNGLKAILSGETLINKMIKIQCDFDFSGLDLKVSHDGIGLMVGKDTSNAVEHGFGSFPKITKTGNLRTDNSVGVLLKNLNRWQLHFTKTIRGFGSGLKLMAENYGTAYNNIHWSSLIDNKINIELYATSTGWVNENKFFGGSASHDLALGTQLMDHHVLKIHMSEDSSYVPDNNVFFSPSFEGSVPYYPIYIHGQQNVIYSGRYESHSGYRYRVLFKGNDNTVSVSNALIMGYGLQQAEIIEGKRASANMTFTPTQIKTTARTNAPVQILRSLFADTSNIQEIKDTNNNTRIATTATDINLYNATNNDYPRLKLSSNGSISMGNGLESPKRLIDSSSYGAYFSNGVAIENSTWENNSLRIGQYHLWISSGGKLRIKLGKPESDSDGSLVGV